jgi:Zn-dependent protease
VFGRAWKIGSVGGVAIRVDSSWAFIAILITYSEYVRFTDPGYHLSSGPAFAVAVFAAFLFFSSILLHELAHAGMARARGIAVSGITLYLFGGATSAKIEDKGPFDEFLVTAVGPGTSFGLSVAFWALSHSVGRPLDVAFHDLSSINFILAVFNLIPGFPLDGGRILRSGLWRATGNLERATRIAARVGVVVGGGLILAGIVEFAQTSNAFSLWLSFIGWFLIQAARGSVQQQRLRRALAGAMVRQAMRPPPRAIPADTTLSASLDGYLRGHEQEGFPVVEGDRVLGVLTFESAAVVGREDPLRPARDAMAPLSEVMTVRADEALDEIADRLAGRAALVLDGEGRLVGSIQATDVDRWLRARN